jgi:pyruvate/2-oxoglutarate dehydrogenase complex dihydrolipoamide dehydrogenase (E3) component
MTDTPIGNKPVQVPPMDEYNQTLTRQCHPADWVNPTPTGRYNLVVIGAGTAGLVAAAGAAGLGGKVALIEKHLLGGDCLNYGCVPSKCLIASGEVAADAREADKYGLRLDGGLSVDFPAVMSRMRAIRSDISEHDSVGRFAAMGVDVFLGEGRFFGPNAVEVAGQRLEFARAIIATGARAATPDIKGLAEAGYLTNETVFSLTARPERLAVIGAGPIGCELAQAFARLGCKVTLIHKHEHILSREDPTAAAIVDKALRQDGIDIKLNAETLEVTTTAGQAKKIHLRLAGQEQTIEVDEILIGLGRTPNVEGLALELAGVEYDARTGVHVDDDLRTSNKRIFAAGDICSKYKFTHAADAAARIAVQNALLWGRKKFSALHIPWCTYTAPEVAHVGMYEHDARRQGAAVDVFSVDFKDVDRAIAQGREDGMVRIIVKKGSDRILGATIVSRCAGEMISEITLAITAGVGLGTLASVIHPYPTLALGIKQAADAYNRTRLTPSVAGLIRWILRRRRR